MTTCIGLVIIDSKSIKGSAYYLTNFSTDVSSKGKAKNEIRKYMSVSKSQKRQVTLKVRISCFLQPSLLPEMGYRGLKIFV